MAYASSWNSKDAPATETRAPAIPRAEMESRVVENHRLREEAYNAAWRNLWWWRVRERAEEARFEALLIFFCSLTKLFFIGFLDLLWFRLRTTDCNNLSTRLDSTRTMCTDFVRLILIFFFS